MQNKNIKKRMITEIKKFHLRVNDNFHYMAESEAYDYGQYNTYEEALIAAKAIVDEFFEFNWRGGITSDQFEKYH